MNIENLFTSYERVTTPEVEVQEYVSPYADVLYGNLNTLVSSKIKSRVKDNTQQEQVPETPYIYKGEVTVQEPQNKSQKIQRIPWSGPNLTDPQIKKNYENFQKELNIALQKRPEYNTPEWRRFLTQLAAKETGGNFEQNRKNDFGTSALGWFQLLKPYRKQKWNTAQEQLDDVFNLLDDKTRTLRIKKQDPEVLRLMEERGVDDFGMLSGLWLKGWEDTFKTLKGEDTKPDGTGKTKVINYFQYFTQL